MENVKSSKLSLKVFMTVFCLSMCFAVMYSLPYVKSMFYDGMIALTGTTNEQLGWLMTVYGVGEVLTPAIGGVLAMKVDYKKIIVYSCGASVIACLMLAWVPSYLTTIIVWGILVFSTLFMVWGTWFKAMRIMATDDQQSMMTGLFFGCCGVGYLLVNSISAWAYDASAASALAKGLTQALSDQAGMVSVFYAYAVFLAVFTIISAILMKKVGVQNQEVIESDLRLAKEQKSVLADFAAVAKYRSVWYFGITLFCMYSATICIQYFTPYFTNVMGVTVTLGAFIAIIRQYGTRVVASPLGGYLAKRWDSISKVIIVAFALTAVSLASILFLPESMRTVTVLTGILLFAAFLNNVTIGIQYAIPTEAKVPVEHYASAVGLGSAIGFTPDIFQHVMFGNWIDNFGAVAYNYIMIYGVVVSLIGVVVLVKFLADKKAGKN